MPCHSGGSPEGRVKAMDAAGIDQQVVSYTTPAQLAPPDHGAVLARAANDRLAAAVAAHPDRPSGFAVLPWQDPAAAAAELDRSVSDLGLKGALIVGRPGETFLDDPRYAPVLRKLSDLRVPLYVHPYHPVPQMQEAYYGGFSPEVTAWLSLGAWSWHNEADVHVLRHRVGGRNPGLTSGRGGRRHGAFG